MHPITKVVNKHVLPIYDEPIIYYPIKTLLDAGIEDILVISNADHIGKYMKLLELEFDADFSYRVQSEPKGIAHGLSLAEEFVGEDNVAVILGDNILFGDASDHIRRFDEVNSGAQIFLKRVDKPSAYGVATVEDGKVTELNEKPDSPTSDWAVIGLYLYTSRVFERIDQTEPSDRGEYEITDVNQLYVDERNLTYSEFTGEWFDVGTPEGLFQASKHVHDNRGTSDR